jgi:hypothetical protein
MLIAASRIFVSVPTRRKSRPAHLVRRRPREGEFVAQAVARRKAENTARVANLGLRAL